MVAASAVARGPARVARSAPLHRRPRPLARRTTVHAATWLESEVSVRCTRVPLAVAWDLWSRRELIPQWMPWVTSVVVDEADDRNSKWTLSTDSTPMRAVLDQLGQRLQYSWTARNLAAVPGQKIHWKAIDGYPNRGAVRFYEDDAGEGCVLKMSISYEVPDGLSAVEPLVKPVLESVIKADLERFEIYALDVMEGRVSL